MKLQRRLTLAATLCLSTVACGQEMGTRHLLIICGHPGDGEFREQFSADIDQIVTALTVQPGFSPEHAVVLFGTTDMHADGGAVPEVATASSEMSQVKTAVREVNAQLMPDDSLWVLVLGHAYFDGRRTWLNLPGDDPHTEQFAELFEETECREQVFWITTSVSGFFARPLAREGRVVITATEADREVNATLMPNVLAELLTEPPPLEEFDQDEDGRATLLDFYLLLTRRIAQRYVDDNLVATEHAQLDDNGDGRITEVQRPFLSGELGGTRREGEATRPIEPGRDGDHARSIDLTDWLPGDDTDASTEVRPETESAL